MNDNSQRGAALFALIQDLEPDLIQAAADFVPPCPSVRRQRRRGLIGLVAGVLLLAGACAYAVVEWSDLFRDHFQPSTVVIEQLRDSVEAVGATAVCGDYILTINQTLGDSYTIYLDLDITFPASQPLWELLQRDAAGEWDLSILPWVDFLPGRIAYEEVAGLNPEQLEDFLQGRRFGGGGSLNIEAAGADMETNTLSCLISFTKRGDSISSYGPWLTLLVREINDPSGQAVAPGPYVISWQPQNISPQLEYVISDSGQEVGQVLLSSFRLEVELYPSEQRAAAYAAAKAEQGELTFGSKPYSYPQVSVTLLDGSHFTGPGSFGGTASDDGYVNYRLIFNEILLLDQVASIQVGDYTIIVNSGE